MSVKVNLLPGDVAKRGQAARSRALVGLAGVVFLLALGAAWFLQQQQIGDREDQLATVQAANAELQAQITILQPFADLEARANSAADIVGLALGTEVSIAGILQDLSAAIPPDVEVESLSITIGTQPRAPAPGGTRPVYGTIALGGRVTSLSPGVERLLIDVGRVAGFDNPAVGGVTTDDQGVTTFSLEIELGPEILTGRYAANEVAG